MRVVRNWPSTGYQVQAAVCEPARPIHHDTQSGNSAPELHGYIATANAATKCTCFTGRRQATRSIRLHSSTAGTSTRCRSRPIFGTMYLPGHTNETRLLSALISNSKFRFRFFASTPRITMNHSPLLNLEMTVGHLRFIAIWSFFPSMPPEFLQSYRELFANSESTPQVEQYLDKRSPLCALAGVDWRLIITNHLIKL